MKKANMNRNIEYFNELLLEWKPLETSKEDYNEGFVQIEQRGKDWDHLLNSDTIHKQNSKARNNIKYKEGLRSPYKKFFDLIAINYF